MSLRLLFSTVCLSCFLSSSREVLKFVNAVLQNWISLTSISKSLWYHFSCVTKLLTYFFVSCDLMFSLLYSCFYCFNKFLILKTENTKSFLLTNHGLIIFVCLIKLYFIQTLKCLISQAVSEAAPHWHELFLWGNDHSSWASYSGWEKAVIWNIWICKSLTTALTLSEVAARTKQANQPP